MNGMTNDAAVALEYVPGRLDETAPIRVWLQIDTDGDNDERDEEFPGTEHVSWFDESIGGLEVQYVRIDLHATTVAELRAEMERLRADARRYRYLRDTEGFMFGNELDAAIDAATKETP